ncbi:unnamed protein product [Cuscuta epithymum]|uniref:GTD-binding domain-containing protein n=1 Tax=Cuscuta epithymum TaxID=186058 RepID=A0AAV0C8Z5_9ASTE|nr:unnamed protein product [Cuscuta epithymum]
MDFDNKSPSSSGQFKCCECDCNCSLVNGPFCGTWLRSVKRKHEECDDTAHKNILPETAKIGIWDECVALREMVCSQQLNIQALRMELDEERNAAFSATNEAMSMILKLQREKAEIQMEFRQFKRFTEEKMAHDQQELAALENLLYSREQVIHSLACEVQRNKQRITGFEFMESEAYNDCSHLCGSDTNKPEMFGSDFEFPPSNYPSVKCFNQNHVDDDNEVVDVEEEVSMKIIPPSQDQLQDLESRINQLEKSSGTSHPPDGEFYEKDMIEKVMMRSTFLPTNEANDAELEAVGVLEEQECSNFKEVNNSVNEVEDEDEDLSVTSDRVYTIDSVHLGAACNGVTNPKTSIEIGAGYTTNPRDSLNYTHMENSDITKLYVRLQALEADRESMRQTIISMQTEKAQLVLLKEIAQQFYKDMPPTRRAPVRKPFMTWSFSILSVFKWMIPSFFWRTRARRCKYMFGMSGSYPGLLILLYKGPRVGQWRCITSTQV